MASHLEGCPVFVAHSSATCMYSTVITRRQSLQKNRFHTLMMQSHLLNKQSITSKDPINYYVRKKSRLLFAQLVAERRAHEPRGGSHHRDRSGSFPRFLKTLFSKVHCSMDINDINQLGPNGFRRLLFFVEKKLLRICTAAPQSSHLFRATSL